MENFERNKNSFYEILKHKLESNNYGERITYYITAERSVIYPHCYSGHQNNNQEEEKKQSHNSSQCNCTRLANINVVLNSELNSKFGNDLIYYKLILNKERSNS